mgnify:CR=1 FL=1
MAEKREFRFRRLEGNRLPSEPWVQNSTAEERGSDRMWSGSLQRLGRLLPCQRLLSRRPGRLVSLESSFALTGHLHLVRDRILSFPLFFIELQRDASHLHLKFDFDQRSA